MALPNHQQSAHSNFLFSMGLHFPENGASPALPALPATPSTPSTITTNTNTTNSSITTPKRPRRSRVGEYGSRRLFVGNISYLCQESHLERLFQQYGRVIDAEITRNERGSKGYGFVSMEASEESIYAKNSLDKTIFQGRIIDVNYARFKNNRRLPQVRFTPQFHPSMPHPPPPPAFFNPLFLPPFQVQHRLVTVQQLAAFNAMTQLMAVQNWMKTSLAINQAGAPNPPNLN